MQPFELIIVPLTKEGRSVVWRQDMRKFVAAATAALGLLGMTTGQVQAQHVHGGGGSFRGGSVHAGSFRGGNFRGGNFRGGNFRGGGFRDGGFRDRGFRGGAVAAGVLGFGLGAALASPYYYDGGYGGYYDDGYYDNGYYDDGYADDPAYACGAWQWDPYSRRNVWVNDCQ
jgi:hypothetical protein